MSKLLSIEEPGQNNKKEEIAIGIDLGTTNSLVAISKDKQVEIICDSSGNNIHPSVLSFDEDEIKIGSDAINNLKGEKIYSIKRLMGKGAKEEENNPLFQIVKDSKKLKISINDKELTRLKYLLKY